MVKIKRTDQRVNLPYFFYALPPEWRRDSLRLVICHVNHRQLADVYRFFLLFLGANPLLQLLPLSPHPVGIPTVIANKLKTPFGDVLGNICDKLNCRADGEVLLFFPWVIFDL